MSRTTVTFAIATMLAFVFTWGTEANAQSGRFATATTPKPTKVSPTSPKNNGSESPKQTVRFVVGLDRRDYLGDLRVTSVGSALLTLVDRLTENPAVKVYDVRREMNYNQAFSRARTEKDAYVILLQLRVLFSRHEDNQRFCLQYFVFEPTSGKVKMSGTTYPRFDRTRNGIPEMNLPNDYGDQQLQAASREAAERILLKLTSDE